MASRWLKLAAVLLISVLPGCGVLVPSMSTGSESQVTAESLSQKDLLRLKPVVERVLARYAVGESPSPEDIAQLKPYSKELYADLVKDKKLRAQAYPFAEKALGQYFSKPDKTDNVPPVRGKALDELKAVLQPGDVVQCGNNGSFIHSLFYVGDDVIIHALAQPMNGKPRAGVVKETFSGYFNRVERDMVVVLRPKWTESKLKKAVSYIKAQVGKDYDTLFLADSEERFYCTELVYKTLKAGEVSKVAPHLANGLWPMVMNEDFRKAGDLALAHKINHD